MDGRQGTDQTGGRVKKKYLKDHLITALGYGPATAAEIAEKVRAAGYATRSRDFPTIVKTTLKSMGDRVRTTGFGKSKTYDLAEEWAVPAVATTVKTTVKGVMFSEEEIVKVQKFAREIGIDRLKRLVNVLF